MARNVTELKRSTDAPAKIGKYVITALRQMATELDEGALLTVDTSRTRLRVLPFQSRP